VESNPKRGTGGFPFPLLPFTFPLIFMDIATEIKAGQKGRVVVKGGLKDFAMALLIVALAGSVVFITVWRRVAFIGIGYEIRSLESRESRLLHIQKEMEIEKAMLSSPDRIEAIARTRLGMVDPEPGQIRTLP
jgi:cell division protein FtsL